MTSDRQRSPELEAFRRGMRERRYREILDNSPERTLAELRKTLSRTQASVAAALGVRQIQISRLERRADLRLSTLYAYIGALGGSLELVVRFRNRAVRLAIPPPP